MITVVFCQTVRFKRIMIREGTAVRDLKKIVLVNLRKLAIAMVVVILLLFTFLQIMLAQRQARDNARAVFLQVEQILQENEAELAQVEAEYRETCLLNAETIAYVVQYHPEIIGDLQEFRELAAMLQVDEIHIFDRTGRIFTGTHPEYYDFTFETGEQIGFFAPLLEDKTLKLCQDITPNTAEGKLVQYSALWSADGQYIVQVGMYPDAVQKATEKNELSYIFSLLQGSPGVDLYAMDAETGEIRGSTNGSHIGRSMTEIGLDPARAAHYRKGAAVTVAGVNSYCVLTAMGDVLICYVIPTDLLYDDVATYTLALSVGLILIAVAFVLIMQRLTNRYIIRSIEATNEKLRAISAGNLDERVDVHSSQEFAELSSHINEMIKSLLASMDKMSLVLDRTKQKIGVYEYNKAMQTVRFTQYIPKLLGLDQAEQERLAGDHRLLQAHIDRLRRESVPGEEHVYHYKGKRDAYIRLEEITSGGDVLGVVMDITKDFTTRRRIEAERDLDPLTGLYNRRGLERQLDRVFSRETDHDNGHGALVMIDLDGLKTINDTYGHVVGDRYIKRLAEVLRDFVGPDRLAARMGGDEFVLLLYGCESEQAVHDELARLRRAQQETTLTHEDGSVHPVPFSFGYVLTYGRLDHEAMLEEADRRMYAVKPSRAAARQPEN